MTMTMYCSYLISLLSNQDKIESSLSMATAIYQDAGYSTSLLPEYSFLILFACARYFITALKISCLNFLSPCPIRTSIIQVLSFFLLLLFICSAGSTCEVLTRRKIPRKLPRRTKRKASKSE